MAILEMAMQDVCGRFRGGALSMKDACAKTLYQHYQALEAIKVLFVRTYMPELH
jgi:hypothetical protein